LDQIAQQLKEEVDSLREYIQRTEEQLLVSNWVDEMITPFEDLEHQFDHEELSQIIGALYKARHQFSVNGHLAGRLDAIIGRYGHLFVDSTVDDDSQLPAKDPQNDNVLDFVEDEEEVAEDNASPLFEPLISSTAESTVDSPASGAQDAKSPHQYLSSTEEKDHPSRDSEGDIDSPITQSQRDNAVLGLFSEHLQDDETNTRSVTENKEETEQASLPLDGKAKERFINKHQNKQPTSARDLDSKVRTQQQRESNKLNSEPPSKILQRPVTKEEAPQPNVNIFSARITVENLLLDMDIQLPEQDIAQLSRTLKNKVTSSTVIALQKSPQAEGQYVLIPRISRFIHNGNLYSCTVKNLARTYIAHFGDIKDLMQYKGMPFLNHDTPQLGWALITKEAVQETYDKNFMEQAQYLRYLSTTTGLPSHLVRRRTLIETIYDMIAGRMVLNTTFLKHTLDWTSDGPSKFEYICAYFSEKGIRLRHLPRTQRNRALGLCPNW